VALVGEEPVAELQKQIARILHAGVTVELPRPLVQFLAERRAAARRHGEWVERHYLPHEFLHRTNMVPCNEC
jgi:hypothetical protein